MIFIIRALYHVRKGWWILWYPMSRDETPDEKRGKKNERRSNKKWEKREKGQCYYPFATLVLQSSTMILIIESLLCYHLHVLVGIIHYRTWLVYSNDGLPQITLGLREQASWMHTHLVSFDELSYILIALVPPLHGNPYSLTLISIDGHLHSPLIRLVDVRLSSVFVSSRSTILFHLKCHIHGSRSCIAWRLKKF